MKAMDSVDCLERSFFETYCNDERYGRYTVLIEYFLSSYRTQDIWINDILPYLDGLKQKRVGIDDWDYFSDKGIYNVLFRHEFVMFVSNDIRKQRGIIRDLKDANGEFVRCLDGSNTLLDSDYLESHYTEYCKVPLDEFIEICKAWLETIEKWRGNIK